MNGRAGPLGELVTPREYCGADGHVHVEVLMGAEAATEVHVLFAVAKVGVCGERTPSRSVGALTG